jgi:arylsulfatase A-like enzyme
MASNTEAAQGSAHFAVALRLAIGALAGCVVLQLFLYLRPSPYGGPFLLEWHRYFLLALYYEMMGVWLLSLPFLLVWLMLYRRPARARALHYIQASLLAANLVLSQLDHEVLRFLGIRLGFSFVATYLRPETASDSLFFDVLQADAGGPYLSLLLLLLVPAGYLGWACRSISRDRSARSRLWLSAAVVLALVPLAAPANAWRMATSEFRLRKVEPVVVALAVDASLGMRDLEVPRDLDRLARAHQQRWLAESRDKAWQFPDPRRPYLRVPLGAPPAQRPWNVILIQLETLRGVDVGHLNPARRPSPTPYLDALAGNGGSTTFTRALSFGQPSINALFAAHCSIQPHSRRFITSFTATRLYCLPEALRRRGYRTEMFNAGDTDWDGSTWWLSRWYDALRRFPEAKEHDRPVFRAAARRLRELGASGRPFLFTIVSVSNHTPFYSRESRFDIAGRATARERILNTTRYTDDVVRELLESLAKEAWFDRTVVVIFGDHGFNLGEHGGTPGELNLYRESVWVPLIFVAPDGQLPGGSIAEPASLLDVAPTVADLLGIREANPWQGHSLISARADRSFGFVAHDTLLAEAGDRTLLTDPSTGQQRAYARADDWLQRRPLRGREEDRAILLQRASGAARLNDFLLRRDRVWLAPGP